MQGSTTYREVHFDRDPSVLADARRIVQGCDDMLAERDVADAKLLITELLSNAIVHGSGDISMCIRLTPESVEFQVHDDGSGGLVAPRTPGRRGGGWGLHFVARLARDWGTHGAGDGTCVWFSLPRL
jgi:anti-sigma regulatory factor (Ser/Thr protein kinase)